MAKICTSIEQSQKLIELGIDMNTVDMYYPNRTDIQYQGALPIGMKHGNPLLSQEIPAWSLSALLGLMSMHCASEPRLCKKFFVSEPNERYHIDYFPEHFTDDYGDPIDAAFEMVCWLLENGKI